MEYLQREIRQWNRLKSDKIKVGEKLLIKSKKEIAVKEEESTRENILYHTVKKGETLEKIAKKYGVSKEDLKVWNNLKSENLKAGQKLIVKGVVSREEKEKKERPKEIIYRVKEGETLRDIAGLFGVSVEELIRINNLRDTNVKPGQRLLIRIPEEKRVREDKSKEQKDQEKKGRARKPKKGL